MDSPEGRGNRHTFLALLRCAHPEPAAAVTLICGLLALGVGHPPAAAVTVTATVAASQLAVGWANDALDADRDAATGRAGKPVATRAVPRRTVGIAAVAAIATTGVLAFTHPAPAAATALLGLASGLAYDWPLKSTPISVLPYAVSFAALPAFVVLALPAQPPGWLLLAGALLGVGGHFANVLPDLAEDAATGIRGLPHRLGPIGARTAAAAALLAATGTLLLGPPGPLSTPAVAAATVVAIALPIGWYAGHAAERAGRRPTALFRTVMTVAIIDAGLLLRAGSTL